MSLRTIQLTAVGDLALYGRVPEAIDGAGADAFCAEGRAALAPGALRFANLEVPLVADAHNTDVMLCGSLSMAHVPRALGLNVVSVANNHIMDAGPDGLRTTLAAVRAQGVLTVGAGENLAEARHPAIVEEGGARIGVLAYAEGNKRLYHHVAGATTPGVAPIDDAAMLADVAALRPSVDVLVVSLHGGVNYMRFAMPEQRRVARLLLAAGADVILGHHPHVLQGVERIGRGLAAYSLGDFICDGGVGNVVRPERVEARRDSAVLTVTLSPGATPGSAPAAAPTTHWTPFRADAGFKPCRLDGAAADAARATLASYDEFYLEGRYPADPWAEAGKEIGGHALEVLWFHVKRGNLGYLAKRMFRIRARHLKMLKGVFSRG